MSLVRRVVSLSIVILACLDALEAREGFGFSKRAVPMTRTRPPAIRIDGSRIHVTAGDALRQLVIDAIVAGDPRFTEARPADAEVTLIVDKLEATESWESHTDYAYLQTGTHDEWSTSKGRYEKKPVYASVPVTKRVRVVNGAIAAHYEIDDGRMVMLDSGSTEQTFHEKYAEGESAPSPDAVRVMLQRDAARVVAARLVATTDSVLVNLPKGSFEPFIALAENGAWSDYLHAIESVPDTGNHEVESYRQYALAVAKEAIAYSMSDHVAAAHLLNDALQHCRNAVDAHVDASMMLKRIETSAAAYAAWR